MSGPRGLALALGLRHAAKCPARRREQPRGRRGSSDPGGQGLISASRYPVSDEVDRTAPTPTTRRRTSDGGLAMQRFRTLRARPRTASRRASGAPLLFRSRTSPDVDSPCATPTHIARSRARAARTDRQIGRVWPTRGASYIAVRPVPQPSSTKSPAPGPTSRASCSTGVSGRFAMRACSWSYQSASPSYRALGTARVCPLTRFADDAPTTVEHTADDLIRSGERGSAALSGLGQRPATDFVGVSWCAVRLARNARCRPA